MVRPAMLADGVGGNGNTSCGFNDGQMALVVSGVDISFSFSLSTAFFKLPQIRMNFPLPVIPAVSLDQLSRPPRLIESCFERATEAENHVPAFARDRLHPVVLFVA